MGRNLSPVSQTNSPIVTIPPTPLEGTRIILVSSHFMHVIGLV